MRPCSCGRWASDTTRRAGKPLYDKPPSCCGGRGDRDGGGGDGDGGGGLGDDGGGGGDSTRREVARGSTGSLGGNLPPHLWALLSGGRPRGQLALYKVAPRRDSVKLRPILDCSSWEDSPEQSTTLTPLLFWLPPLEAAAAESVPLLLGERRALGERLQACSGFSSRASPTRSPAHRPCEVRIVGRANLSCPRHRSPMHNTARCAD